MKTRQRENFLVLMANYGKALDYTTTAATSAGTALSKMSDYEEGIEASTKKFTATLENLWNNAINANTIKDLIDMGTKIISVLDSLISHVGGFVPVLALVTAGYIALNLVSKVHLLTTLASIPETIANTAALMAEAYAVDGLSGSLKVLNASTGILGLALTVISVAIYAVVKATDDYNHALENSEKKTKDLDTQIKAMTDDQASEYNTLLAKVGNLTDQEAIRLGILEAQLDNLKKQKALSANQSVEAYSNQSVAVSNITTPTGMGSSGHGRGSGKTIETKENQLDYNKQLIDSYNKLDQTSEDYNKNRSDSIKKMSTELASLQGIIDAGGQLTPELQDQYDSFSTIVGGYYAQIDKFYSGIKTALNGISTALSDFSNNGKVSATTISNIQKNFADVSGIDGYITTLKSAKLTSADLQKTMGELTQAKLNNMLATQDLSGVTTESISKILSEIGVTNADELANNALAKAKLGATVSSLNGADAINDYINKLGTEAAAANITKVSLANLVAQEIIFNESGLNVSGKLAQLKSLALAANITSSAISNATSSTVGGSQRLASNKGLTTTADSANYVFGNMWSSAVGDTSAQFSSATGSSSDGGFNSTTAGGSKSSSDTAHDYNKFWKEEQNLSDAENAVTKSENAIKDLDTSTIAGLEQKNDLIAKQNVLYQNELTALHNLADAKRTQIETDQEMLQSKYGVDSTYDASTNRLVIDQDKLNSLTKTGYTDAKTLADAMTSLNTANESTSASWDDVNEKIQANITLIQTDIKAINSLKYSNLETGVKSYEDYLSKQQAAFEKAKQAEIDLLKTEHDATETQNTLLEDQNNLLEAQKELLNGENEKDIKQLQGNEWVQIANPSTIKSLSDAVSSAQKTLNTEVATDAYNAAIDALQKEIDASKTTLDNTTTALDAMLATQSDMLTGPIDGLITNLSKLNSYIDGINSGETVPQAISGTSNSSKNISLTSAEGKSLLSLMVQNSKDYSTATDADKVKLHNGNNTAGAMLGLTYNSSDGHWYSGSTKVYHSGTSGVGGITFDPQQEEFAKLLKGEIVLDKDSILNGIGLMNGLSNLSNISSIVNNSNKTSSATDNSQNIGSVNINNSGGLDAESFLKICNNVKKIK